MNSRTQMTFVKIFIQLSIVLVFFVSIGGVVEAKTSSQNLLSDVEVQASDSAVMVDDKKLAGRIRSTIAFNNRLYSARVKVKVKKSVVIYYGIVDSQSQYEILLEIAEQVANTNLQVDAKRLQIVSKNPQQSTSWISNSKRAVAAKYTQIVERF